MLPALPDWQPTQSTLHHAAQVISDVRKAAIPPLPNHLHHSITPTPYGATTGDLPHLGRFSLDFAHGTITHIHNSVDISHYTLTDHSPTSLYAAISDELHEMEYDIALKTPSDLSDQTFKFDPAHGQSFAAIMQRMFNAIAQAKAHYLGFQTPLVLWSHGFDLSTLWFAHGSDEEEDPHMNFGFSPGTSAHPEPYIYAYAHPTQTALRDALPDGFQWNTDWSTHGALMPYSALTETDTPENMIAAKLVKLYQVGAAALTGA
jgi:hypothetical protein